MIINERIDENPSNGSGLDALSRAGAHVAQQDAEFESKKNKEESERKNRGNIADAGYEILNELIENSFDKMLSATPNAVRNGKHEVSLGEAYLEFALFEYGRLIFKHVFKDAGWDVVASARITVVQKFPPYTWGASLWYMKRNLNDEYRWHEISYMNSPFSQDRTKCEPFAVKSEEFCDRWADQLSRAAQGSLQHPQRLPLSEDYFK